MTALEISLPRPGPIVTHVTARYCCTNELKNEMQEMKPLLAVPKTWLGPTYQNKTISPGSHNQVAYNIELCACSMCAEIALLMMPSICQATSRPNDHGNSQLEQSIQQEKKPDFDYDCCSLLWSWALRMHGSNSISN